MLQCTAINYFYHSGSWLSITGALAIPPTPDTDVHPRPASSVTGEYQELVADRPLRRQNRSIRRRLRMRHPFLDV